MNYISTPLISHFKAHTFYKQIFPIKKLFKEFLNIIIKGSSSFPLSINMLITDKCNFACKMCSWKGSGGTNNNLGGKKELNIDDIQKFISQIKIYHPLVHIGGGEPFIRQDLLDIATIIKRSKLKCLITTNGFLMNEGIIEKLVKLKVDALIFSLYGWAGLHDEITGVERSFKRIIANLSSVLEKRIKYPRVFVSTLPLPENINALKQLVKNLHGLGIDGIKIEQLNFLTRREYNRSLEHKGTFNLSPATFIKENPFNKEFITALMKVYEDICGTYGAFVYIKPNLNKTQLIDWYTAIPSRNPRCFFISHSIFINYNGDIIPCQFFTDSILGNIKKDSLESVWKSKRYKELRKTINNARLAICQRCCKN